jgi:hypothetical protein
VAGEDSAAVERIDATRGATLRNDTMDVFGTAYGDAVTMDGSSRGGNDTISVSDPVHAEAYGDAATLSDHA